MQHLVRNYSFYLDEGGKPGTREYKPSFDGVVRNREDIAMFSQEMRAALQQNRCIFEPRE